jgi:hypothetical protein
VNVPDTSAAKIGLAGVGRVTAAAEARDHASALPLSPVIRALRFAGEEVQFGLVLASVCLDPGVAAAFADLVIARARYGNPSARRRARRQHGEIYCLGEQQLNARVARRLSRARTKDVGRVDLKFAGAAGWKLAIELKLNSDFGRKQLQGYAEWGPVACIVRDPSHVVRMTDHPNWVGVVSWDSVTDDLRALPVDPRWAPDWRALLDVMESDGDFDVKVPDSREGAAQAELLQKVAQPLVERLAKELRRVYKANAQAAASGLKASRVFQSRTWAGVGIDGQDGPWLWIGVRGLWSPAPRIRIDYYPFTDWHAKRRLATAHARIESRLGFERRRDTFRMERPMPRLEQAGELEVEAAVGEILSAIVDARVFDVEIERLNRR